MILAELFPYSHVVFTILTIVYGLTILGTIGVVVSENRNPVKSLAWVTVLLLLPIIGFVIYAFFGRSLKSIHMISRKNNQQLTGSEKFNPIDLNELKLSEENMQQIYLIKSLVNAHYFPGNKIDIFTSGKEKFDALKRDLLNAKHYIHLQYYIFENDRLGNEICDLLIKKAQEGVKVRVIYDHVGSFNLRSTLFKRMRKNGVEALPFLKVSFPELANRINWRNHRKIVIIDGEIGYIGGMNIADRYVDGSDGRMWRDTHLRIVGEAINGLNYSFAVDWNFTARQLVTEPTKQFDVQPNDGDGIQLVTSGPTDRWSNLGFVFFKAISNARKCVYLQTPYFLPNDSLLKVLQVAALSGIDVRVMIPRYPDSKLLKYASYSYIKECLEAGVKIYLYDAGMLHAKAVIVDDELATTGSTNFDFRSFEHNFECNAVIYSTSFNKRMKDIFVKDMEECTCVDLEEWKKRPLKQKIWESIVRLMSPIM
jgi:cardiolipin synthase